MGNISENGRAWAIGEDGFLTLVFEVAKPTPRLEKIVHNILVVLLLLRLNHWQDNIHKELASLYCKISNSTIEAMRKEYEDSRCIKSERRK